MARPATEGFADRILDSALEQFCRHGFKQTSMAKIARGAQAATGTLYLYFASKEDVLRACAKRFHAIHREQAAALLASGATPEKNLLEYILRRHDHWVQETGQARGVSDFAQAMSEVDVEISKQERQLWTKTITNILGQGRDKGTFHFASAEVEGRIFFQCLIGFFPLPGLAHPFQPSKSDLKTMVEWFLRKWTRK